MRPSGTPRDLEQRRLRAVQLLAEGFAPVEVARQIGVHEMPVDCAGTTGIVDYDRGVTDFPGMAGIMRTKRRHLSSATTRRLPPIRWQPRRVSSPHYGGARTRSSKSINIREKLKCFSAAWRAWAPSCARAAGLLTRGMRRSQSDFTSPGA
jgi:hypothetical protein